ncbi:hypothetical protein KY284_020285 [Solanum tuberosum]|nr:hypothetical protein KY284_020285 [Solanum tuberosum]
MAEELLKEVALGPESQFQTEEVSRNRKTNNSSVYIQGDVDGTGQTIEYYGVIQEIIEVRYSGWPKKKIVLFRCEWFDPSHRGTNVDHQHNIIEVKHSRKYISYDPFIIAQNAKQVYYAPYPLRRDKADWWVVIKSEDGDRHHEHLGVSQTKQVKKKSRRPIDHEDIAGSISSMPEHISHDTHLFDALPSRRYEDLPLQAIRRARPLSAGTPSPTGTPPQLSAMRIGDSSSEQSDAMAGTPPLTQHFEHPDVSPSFTATPSATPDGTMPALAPG